MVADHTLSIFLKCVYKDIYNIYIYIYIYYIYIYIYIINVFKCVA